MIPFNQAWPYEKIMGDLFFAACPFCGAEQVMLPLKPQELQEIQTGKKKLLVLPCCYESVKLLDADADYLLTDRQLKG